jgi:hypothetical protein
MPMTEDEISTMILGIKRVHDMRMEHLFDVFKREFKLDEYCTDPEALANREKLFKVIDEVNAPQKKGKKNVQKA